LQKKKIKISIILSIICTLIIGISEVKAENVTYFTSNNGIQLTEKEYNLFVELYGEKYTYNLTQEQYDFVNNKLDINNKEVETNVTIDKVENPFEKYSAIISPKSTYIQTAYKKLAISKACSGGSCNMVVVLQWLQSPAVRSYDVMGIRHTGTVNVPGTILTMVETNEPTVYCGSYKFTDDGFGCSIKLSETASSIYITQAFVATGTGRIYASYQHATTVVSKLTSQKYNINAGGYGSVFDFYGTAQGIYDDMPGVYMYIQN